MEKTYRILFIIICIAVVLYAFMTLQFLLGMIAAVVIIITILILPSVEQWTKSR